MILIFTAELIRMRQWGGRGMRLHSLAIPALLVLQIKDSVLGQPGVDVQVFCSCGPEL